MASFPCTDSLGPAKVIHIYEPALGLKGTLVIDNVAAGPSIGGLRMAADVTTDECMRLARAMTLKNAAAGLPHGGGKSVLRADPGMPREEKEKKIRAFAYALRNEADYIFGPDMGTDEKCMGWVKDEIGRSVGLPEALGGIPLDEFGATGFGLMHACASALSLAARSLAGTKIVIQGFGAVGRHAARFLSEKGALIVGVADTGGGLAHPGGLNIQELLAWKKTGRSVAAFAGGSRIGAEELIGLGCDVWIPAARPDVIDLQNLDQLKARYVIPGANIPMSDEAETALHKKGVIVVPDFVANAGGVICAAMEYHGLTKSAAFAAIEEKVASNTRRVLEESKAKSIRPRDAALAMASERIQGAMETRRFQIF